MVARLGRSFQPTDATDSAPDAAPAGGFHVLVEHAQVAVRVDQAPHLRLGEADHLVEVPLQADVGADVEAAGDVVHGDRRHAGDKQALQTAAAAVRAGLQGGEEVAVEAAAVGEGVVRLGAVVGEHDVGEVVVLVDQHVQRDVMVARVPEQHAELGGDGGRRQDALQRRFGKQVGMALERSLEFYEAVGLELPLQGFELVVDRREVEAQGDVAALFPGRVLPDIGAGEGGLEVVRPEAVVVVLQQRHPQRLAEPARADQEGVALFFQAAHEAGLVDIQPPVQANAPEVGLAVGNARVCGWRAHCGGLDADAIFSKAPEQWSASDVIRHRASYRMAPHAFTRAIRTAMTGSGSIAIARH